MLFTCSELIIVKSFLCGEKLRQSSKNRVKCPGRNEAGREPEKLLYAALCCSAGPAGCCASVTAQVRCMCVLHVRARAAQRIRIPARSTGPSIALVIYQLLEKLLPIRTAKMV
eukprot:1025678-Pleurochrysis_carterae.AAC.1